MKDNPPNNYYKSKGKETKGKSKKALKDIDVYFCGNVLLATRSKS